MNIIELRDNTLILVKAKKTKNLINVIESDVIELDDNYKVVFNNPDMSTKLILTLRHFFSHDRDSILCLSTSSIIYRDIITPKTNEKYLKSLVKHELINALNLSSDYLIDYSHIGEIQSDNVKQNKLLVTAIQTTLLNEILQFFTRCGINIKRIDVSNNALVNYVYQNKLLNQTENSILVDITNKQMRQYLFENGQFSYHRNTKINLDNNDEKINYDIIIDAIEKMIQFSLAQGRIKTVHNIIFIGYPLSDDRLVDFGTDLKLNISKINTKNAIQSKSNDDTQLIYALSMLYKLRKKKNIDLMILYNTLNQKNDLVERINPAFMPSVAILTYVILTTLIILVIKTYDTNKSINEINAYLTQDEVLSKMYEITESQARSSKMNEILVEIDNIQGILDKMPRYNQTIINQLYSVKPEEVSVLSVNYANSEIELEIETIDASLIYQYVTALKNTNFFDEVMYDTYTRVKENGTYESTLRINLKELE